MADREDDRGSKQPGRAVDGKHSFSLIGRPENQGTINGVLPHGPVPFEADSPLGPTGPADSGPQMPPGPNGSTGPSEASHVPFGRIGPTDLPPAAPTNANLEATARLAISAGAILREDGSPLLREDGTPLLREGADTARIDGYVGLSQRTIIVRSVLSNPVQAQITAVSLLSAIELKIEELRASGSNSEIDAFHDLKCRVEEFLAANAKQNEAPIADATLSIADGLRRFWTEKHVSICKEAVDMTLFGAGLAFCGVAGVLTVPTALTVGAIVGGRNVVEVLKAGARFLDREDGDK
ncbi:hypothetical protein [Bradyrhizobium sp. ORS 111]|uniref:hypothetical protein n=1 Tax=Bradyrhizobium sp. ORS 111 TaxID=1685958 RepID=UPI00388FAD27